MKQLSHIFIFAFLFSACFFTFAEHTGAQQFDLYSADDISVDIKPEIPGPNEQVDLRVTSYSFNLNNEFISWFKNGQRVLSGFGERDYSFTNGNTGEPTNITIVVDYQGRSLRKELGFAPSNIDLLWETVDSYTPPFYKGKALPIRQSEIRVTGIPETLLIEPNDAPNLIYYWDRNYDRQVRSSGFGRQSFEFTADPIITNERISVTSNDRRENSFAENVINIDTAAIDPEILFYEMNTDGRLLTQKSLRNFPNLLKDTIRLAFHPVYFSTTARNFTDVFVRWNVNGRDQAPQDFAKQNQIFLTTNGESGSLQIETAVEGIKKILQKGVGRATLNINLGS
ncbi:hypothetical protein CL684_00360 [Candidatus Campbellbacteria bacterium]|nr:hypothetical protein [Candidatus Campbellbacteria bacterium]